MAALSLVPLRPADLEEAASFVMEAAEWAPISTPNPDPSLLGSPNSVWFSALSEDKFVGILGYHNISWIDGSAEVAMGVTKSWRGKGAGHFLASLAKSKMLDLRLRRLVSCTVVGGPSSKICTKGGWAREGLFRKARLKDGLYVDVEVYTFTRPVSREADVLATRSIA